jgi:hypothetical protein
MNRIFLFLTLTFTAGVLQAQTAAVPNMMQTSIDKIKVSSDAGRVIERTFSDVIFRGDSTNSNCWFYHRMSASNSYRINGFAPSEDVSALNVYVYYKDDNNKWQMIASNSNTGNDVSLRFSPTVTRFYAIVVRGTLRTNINTALFNLIIERE